MISENFRLFDEVMPFVCLLVLKSKPSHQKVLFYDIVYVITKMYKNVWTHWGMLTITSARENPYWWTGVYPTDTWLIYTRIYTYKRVPRVSCHQLLDKNILCCHKNGIQIFRNGNIHSTLRPSKLPGVPKKMSCKWIFFWDTLNCYFYPVTDLDQSKEEYIKQ